MKIAEVETSVGDDCAILGIADKRVRGLYTVDFFKAGVLDMDPYRFGRIAAIHSLSDIYAMGISLKEPDQCKAVALSLCGVPLA